MSSYGVLNIYRNTSNSVQKNLKGFLSKKTEEKTTDD